MRVLRMATTVLTGSSAEFSSGPGHGMADTTAVAGAEAITAVEVITAAVAIMAAEAIVQATAAEAMVTVVAPMDTQPTVDAAMPGAVTAPAEAGSMAAEAGSTAAVVDMAAAIANGLAVSATAKSPRGSSWAIGNDLARLLRDDWQNQTLA